MNGPACPACGEQLTEDLPDWWRCSHRAACPIGASEDGRAVADTEMARNIGKIRRPTTDAERALLGARGLTAPADSQTVVVFASPGVRLRHYPNARPTPTTEETS